MLLRQDVQVLVPFETHGLHFKTSLRLGHPVKYVHRNGLVFGPVLNHDQSTARSKGLQQPLEHFDWVGKFVVGHHNQGQVDTFRRKIGGLNRPQNRFNVPKSSQVGTGSQRVQERLLKIDGKDTSVRHHRRQPHRVVPLTRADVRYAVRGAKSERRDQPLRQLPYITRGPFKPGLEMFDLQNGGDFATLEKPPAPFGS